MSIRIKAKIRYNGQEFSDPSQLPPEVRVAYENAMKSGGSSNAIVKRRFSVNGQTFDGDSDMPDDVRALCDDVMSVIENNGEVTLPNSRYGEPIITKRQVISAVVIAGTVVALAWVALGSH